MNRYILIILAMFMFATIANAQSLSGLKLCIDPGHGGHESDDRENPLSDGSGTYWESERNLKVAYWLEDIFQELGATTKLTRHYNENTGLDSDPSLSQRVAVANAFEADHFHSLHSNAGGGTANYTVCIFKGQTNTSPTYPEAKRMSDIMTLELFEVVRTTTKYSWADVPFCGFNLGVLNGTDMPASLSECSMHDYEPEKRRLMNDMYEKNQVWAIVRSYLTFYNQPGLSFGELGGIIKDESGTPINYVTATLNPGNKTYTGDGWDNGCFGFDRVDPGTYTLTISKPGYASASQTITVEANKYQKFDFTLTESNIETPVVVAPEANQSGLSTPINFIWRMSGTTGCDFRIQVAKSKEGWSPASGFSSVSEASADVPVNCGTATDTSYSWSATSYGNPFEGPQENTKYYVSVRAYRSDLGVSAYSEPVLVSTFPAGTTFIDDFETDRGHFSTYLTLSGSTEGIKAMSTLARLTDNPHSGEGVLEAVMVDSAEVSTDWFIRMLSGGGNPANNVKFAGTGVLSFWMKSHNAAPGAQIAVWIDDSDGLEESARIDVINDGQWHNYIIDLDNFNGQTITTGNGQIDGSEVSIDAIIMMNPNNSTNWTVYFDDILHMETPTGNPIPNFTVSGLPAKPGMQVSFDASASSDFGGSITDYNWNFGDGTTANGITVSKIYSSANNYNVSLTVTDDEGNTSTKTQNVEIVDCIPPANTDIVIDYGDAGYSETGSWYSSTSTPGYLGDNYRHDNNTSKGNCKAVFTPQIETSGTYEVFIRHTTHENRASNVPVTVSAYNETKTTSVNQRENNGTWVSLGFYIFAEGNTGYVEVSNAGTDGYVIADGVKFVFRACENINVEVSADFTPATASVCQGGNVSYTNLSQNATSYAWTFEGGTPTTSTLDNPTVTYATAGSFDVSLVATDGNQTDTKALTDIITVNPLAGQPNTPQGNTTACNNAVDTYTTSGAANATSYTWVVTPETAATITGNGASINVDWNDAFTGTATIAVKASNNCGDSQLSDALTVNVSGLPIAGFEASETTVLINESIVLNNTSENADSYNWTLTGATPAQTSETSPTISYASAGTYSIVLEAINGCGSITQEKANYITVIDEITNVEVPSICMVTVDSQTGKNVILWDKQATTNIASYNIYRETFIQDEYVLIGNVPYSNDGKFEDSDSDPTVKANRYKIAAIDLLDNETALSDTHKTIHLTINQGVGSAINLIWDEYSGFDYSSYKIYRGTSANDLTLLVQLQNSLTTYTDVNPPAGAVYYAVEAVNPNTCSSALKAGYKTAKSNIANTVTTSISDYDQNRFNLYPNPVRNKLFINYNPDLKGVAEIVNSQGQIIRMIDLQGGKTEIEVSDLANGMYMLRIGSNYHRFIKH